MGKTGSYGRNRDSQEATENCVRQETVGNLKILWETWGILGKDRELLEGALWATGEL